ncbi:MAG: ATP-binding cassette domain-containing protein [Candidatus Thorarchaeota archaeon]
MSDTVNAGQRHTVELTNVTKVYGAGAASVTAVDDISLHVERGEMVVLMGPSGSGKTTLIQLIGALLSPSAGEIRVNGRSFTGLSKRQLSMIRLQEMGFVFQNPNLLSSLTASQNVELVLNLSGVKGSRARQTADRLLDRMGLAERLDHKPSQLSGGEQQRVAIARAIANDPQLILADEPTANLDSKTGHQVIELLRQTAKEKGKTVIIATHDLRIRDLADRVLWLEDGVLSVRWSKEFMIDPVCLMLVDRTTRLTAVYQSKKYYFCNNTCMDEFLRSPDKYEGKGSWNGVSDRNERS